jgi:hypothetical protein
MDDYITLERNSSTHKIKLESRDNVGSASLGLAGLRSILESKNNVLRVDIGK